MQGIIRDKQDMTYLSWSKIRNSSGTAGSFLKAYSELGGKKIYYKLSNFDTEKGVVGHECVNEIIIDRLLDILGIPHLHYQLIHADVCVREKTFDVFLCASEDLKKGERTKSPWMPIGKASIWKARPHSNSASGTDGNRTSIRCWWWIF